MRRLERYVGAYGKFAVAHPDLPCADVGVRQSCSASQWPGPSTHACQAPPCAFGSDWVYDWDVAPHPRSWLRLRHARWRARAHASRRAVFTPRIPHIVVQVNQVHNVRDLVDILVVARDQMAHVEVFHPRGVDRTNAGHVQRPTLLSVEEGEGPVAIAVAIDQPTGHDSARLVPAHVAGDRHPHQHHALNQARHWAARLEQVLVGGQRIPLLVVAQHRKLRGAVGLLGAHVRLLPAHLHEGVPRRSPLL
mmetsp:Transcript_73147/g.208428  ORF Transcript_73147/g.208428 Transcript_73147/m.208428 type:complete len:249 (+) Transcript_73147:233-979(+)